MIITANVATIGEYAFNDCHTMATVTFNNLELIKVINRGTFRNCYVLNGITLPKTVDYIGAVAFENCIGLTSFTFPRDIEEIGEFAFFNCSNEELTELIVPDTVNTIGFAAFGNCTGLETITLPFVGKCDYEEIESEFEGMYGWIFGTGKDYLENEDKYNDLNTVVTALTNETFYIPTSLVKVNIVNNTYNVDSTKYYVTIGEGAFYKVSNINSLYSDVIVDFKEQSFMNSSISTIDVYGSSQVGQMNFPTSVKSIGKNAFNNCDNIVDIVISENIGEGTIDEEGIGSIGDYAFAYCDKVVNITLENAKLGNFMFAYNTKLNKIVIPANITEIGTHTFAYCTNLGYVDDYLIYYGFEELTKEVDGEIETYNVLKGKDNYQKVEERIKFENEIIGTYMFRGCTGIQVMYIPNNITEIGAAAFDACTSMNAIHIPFVGARAYPKEIDGKVNFAAAQSEEYLFGYIFGKTVDDLETRIDQAYNSTNNGKVPNTEEDILFEGKYPFTPFHKDPYNGKFFSFYIPTALTTVNMDDDNADFTHIPHGAFMNCTNIVLFELPSHLKTIGMYAFYNVGMVSLKLPDGIAEIGNGAFAESDIEEVTIHNIVMADRQFYGCDFLKKVTILSEVIEVGYEVFGYCTNLEELIIPFVGKNYNDNAGNEAGAPDLTGDEKILGYLFGTTYKEEFVEKGLVYKANQRSSDTAQAKSYYIPTSLKRVVVTNDTQISYGAFMNCINITCVVLPDYRYLKGNLSAFPSPS